ncbi:MAG: glycosyltransferase family 4 protein [Lachnospiraceae bacterium]|nr:glycosyltransferase family 4 protein [Lachnospiraceae bacterium]
MKRVLVISETVVLPVERGNRRRVYNLIEMMRRAGCEVDYLYLQTYDNEDPEETKVWIGEDHFFVCRNKKRSFPVFVKRKFRKLMELTHCQIALKYFSLDERITPDIDDFMRDFLKEHHYDILWAEYMYNSRPLLSAPEGCKRVLDTHNVFSFKRQMYEAVGYYDYEFALKKETEAEGLGRADTVVAIQEEEAEFFRSIAPEGVKVVTIGENMPACEPFVADTKDILFLGSFYVVNRQGLKDFIDNILPLIKKKCPEAKLKIAGTICRHIQESPDYELLGIVDDVSEQYRSARVVINPVNYGTGLNIKSIEALSHGRPLVSHSVGVRGLRSDPPVALVADEPEAFADAVVSVLENEEQARSLSENACRFMKEYREKNLAALQSILED